MKLTLILAHGFETFVIVTAALLAILVAGIVFLVRGIRLARQTKKEEEKKSRPKVWTFLLAGFALFAWVIYIVAY